MRAGVVGKLAGEFRTLAATDTGSQRTRLIARRDCSKCESKIAIPRLEPTMAGHGTRPVERTREKAGKAA